MTSPEHELDRLFRMAAAAAPDAAPEMPYGFETRVVALARESRLGAETWQLARLFRRLALMATVILAFASSAAYWQMTENEELAEPLQNAYAIADTAIDAGVYP